MKPSHPRVALALGLALLVTTSAQAQAVANGPYYATPSWDLKIPCETPAACPRFVVLADWNQEAVLDRETGLVWTRAPEDLPRTTLLAAIAECYQLGKGGRRGWRLPALAEIQSLSTTATNAMPNGHPFNFTGSSSYWTSTLPPGFNGAGAYNFNPNTGIVDLAITVGMPGGRGVWCVRGGAGPFIL